MSIENSLELITNKTTINLQSSSSVHHLKRLSPDEIFMIIDQLNAGLEPPPPVIEQWFSAGKRDYARIIEEAKIEAVKARKNMIEGLSEHINVYIEAHKSELKIRAEELVTETFDRILLHLAQINDMVISGFYDVYLEFVDNIMRKTNLPHDMLQTAIANAAERLKIRSEQSQKSIYKITENLREEIIRFNSEIGMC